MIAPVRLTILTDSVERTHAVGATLAAALLRSSASRAIVIGLNGEMGVGKTTLIGGLLRSLNAAEFARSPTYTLIEPYEIGDRTVYHLDLYRLVDPRDLEMLAIRDLLSAGSIVLVEWAEKAGKSLPVSDLTLNLRYVAGVKGESQRRIELLAATPVGKELAESLQSFSDKGTVSP